MSLPARLPAPKAKSCPSCYRILPVSRFHRDPQNADGYKTKCRDCVAVQPYRRIVPPSGLVRIPTLENPRYRIPSLAERVARHDATRRDRSHELGNGAIDRGALSAWAAASYTEQELRRLDTMMGFCEAFLEVFEERLAPAIDPKQLAAFRAAVGDRAEDKAREVRALVNAARSSRG